MYESRKERWLASRGSVSRSFLLLFAALLFMCIEMVTLQAADIRKVLSNAEQRIEEHRKRDATVRLKLPNGDSLPVGATASIQLHRHRFLFGSNFFRFGEDGGAEEVAYRDRFRETMNIGVLPFYWVSHESERGKTNASRWMEAAKWCQQNNISTKGHPLVWNLEPEWLRALAPRETERLLWQRITTEVTNFRGVVDQWDVLNEPTEGVKFARDRSATALLHAYRRYGVTGVTKHAFELARKANPNAKLTLNDYVTTNEYIKTIQRAIDAGTPIDVVGIQSHMHSGYWGAAKLWDICERFSKLGRPLHFTELTILSGDPKPASDTDWTSTRTDWYSTPSGEALQAKQLTETYTLLFSHPAVDAIIWWDLSDKGGWMGAPGGLLRADMSPKPAYNALRNLVKVRWGINLKNSIKEGGLSTFRGFYGDYMVTVEHDGQKLRGDFSLEQADSGVIDVVLRVGNLR